MNLKSNSKCHAARATLASLFVMTCVSIHLQAEEPYRPTPGEFPTQGEFKSYRGELVFVDHVNRRGSLRLHVVGHFREGPLHHFAMLPYGVIRYRGAPAELRDIPIGTVLYGRFYLPPEEKTSVVPHSDGKQVTAPRENHAVLLEDGPSIFLREGKSWRLKEVQLKESQGTIVVERERIENVVLNGGRYSFTIDGSTRIWRGRELLGLSDLVNEKTWPANGTLRFDDQPVQLALSWHPRYLYREFHVSDLWLDQKAMDIATERQRQLHLRHIRTRWMPAKVDEVQYGSYGQATVTVTLFGGMDETLYADFKPGIGGKMAAAENTLRTWWPDHDGMDGKIKSVTRSNQEPPLGSSGIQVEFEVPLILEGFRPGRIVRMRPAGWPNVKPPVEERVRGQEDRWPSPKIFEK